ncbi:MAG: Gldg family protein [Gammaproteobacteria bacterium]
MEINNKTRRQLRFQAWTFIVLFLTIIGLVGWISTRYNSEFDWTATGRNSLSKASIAVLSKLKAPVKITSFASGGDLGPIRSQIRGLVKRYQKYSKKIHLDFIDPMNNPEQTRKLGIRTDGEMIVHYQGRSQSVKVFNEQSLTNAMQRLLRNAERKIVFVTGHGERSPLGRANFDLGDFFKEEENKGFKVSTINLTQSLAIPSNTSVLVIASPQMNYLPGEVSIIKKYLEKGGNLWWMQEPRSKATLKGLADYLHIKFMDGVIVDLEIRMLGVNDPTIVMGQYLPHAITNNFKVLTLFPRVTGIDYQAKGGWTDTPFLESVKRSWLETGPLQGTIKYNPGKDVKGPVKFGVALTRTIYPDNKSKDKKAKSKATAKPIHQRVVVMGDGDFMSNTYLGNQGNQQMADNILNWLTHDDNFINIPERTAPGSHLVVSKNAMISLGTLYLVVIPLLLVGAGVLIWLRRRKR